MCMYQLTRELPSHYRIAHFLDGVATVRLAMTEGGGAARNAGRGEQLAMTKMYRLPMIEVLLAMTEEVRLAMMEGKVAARNDGR